ncbi:ATP-binding protein [Rhodanobacter hydrolyticus]|uniref:Sensor histidine kinase n=1 Tax=Rhodanobacter hydrolyticus TaxID=2250595 RepID=A0ABW8J947_9GAMM
MARLRPRARIIRTIGDQLISGPEAALIELVKNSYDADASSVRIRIEPKSEDEAGGLLTVEDDGHGMSAADLVEKWMEPATTDKIERRVSPSGRRMLGAKGVGRFATAKLGRYLDLVAAYKSPGRRLEVTELKIDWDEFYTRKYLDEVNILFSSKVGGRGDRPGVSISIRELRDSWTSHRLEALVRELRRLASPVGARETSFRIHLDLSSFTEATAGFDGQSIVAGALASLNEKDVDPTVIRPLFNLDHVYHYKVSGTFDASGRFKGAFVNQRGDSKPVPIRIEPSALEEGEEKCGKIKLRINIYDREGEAVDDLIERLGLDGVGRLDARRLLNENIGIGIYREGFRIRPYGDPETDWLELERRRVQDPSLRLGHNQVWGVVEIEDEGDSGLTERSSREGLDHNGSFLRLKRLVTDLLVTVEQDRQNFRQSAGFSRKKAGDTSDVRKHAGLRTIEREINQLPPRYRERFTRALRKDSAALKTAIEDLESYQQALASRSTLGLVVAQVLHDGRRFLSDITTRSKGLADGASRIQEKSAFGEHFRSSFGKNAQSIHQSAGGLNKLFKALDPVSGRRRGRPTDFDASRVMQRCLDLFSDAIQREGIVIEFNNEGSSLLVRGYEADLMAALLNIIDNAVHWLGTSPARPRVIRITTGETKKYVRIALSNNGPPIDDRFHQRLFSPGFTLKTEGSGIGLAIAREAMRGSKGDVAFDGDARDVTFVIEMQRSRE